MQPLNRSAGKDTSGDGMNVRGNSKRSIAGGMQPNEVVSTAEGLKEPELPRRSLLETRDNNSFCRNIDLTLQHIHVDHLSEESMIPEQTLQITTRVEASTKTLREFDERYQTESFWSTVETFQKLLEDALNQIKSAMDELRHYIPAPAKYGRDYRRTVSLESVESTTSEKECVSHYLKIAIQSGYEIVQDRYNDYVNFVTLGYQREQHVIDDSSKTVVARASQMLSFLGSLVEFETQTHGLDDTQFTLTINQQRLKKRQQGIVEMFHTLCKHIMILQESLFFVEHLVAKGEKSIQNINLKARNMVACWKELDLVKDRLTRICPMYTEVTNDYYGRLLWHAASLIATMQDCHKVRNFLTTSEPIAYEVVIIRDTTKAQLWLLTCVDQVHRLVTRLSRRMKSRAKKSNSAKSKPPKMTPLFQDLRRVMYDLIMVTIGRAAWLNSCQDLTSAALLRDLRAQGSKTLALVLNYNRSDIALKCDQDSTVEDVSLYSALVCATNVLRTGVLQLHGLIQRLGEPADETETIYRSSSPAKDDDDNGGISFHTVKSIRSPTPWANIRTHPVSLVSSCEFDISGRAVRQDSSAGELTTKNSADDDLGALTRSPWLDDMDDSAEDDDDSMRPSVHGSIKRPSLASKRSSFGSLDLTTVYLDVGLSGDMETEFALNNDPNTHSPMDFNVTLPSPPVSPPRPRPTTSPSPFAVQQPSGDPSQGRAWSSPSESDQGIDEIADVVSVVSSGLVKDVLAVDLIPGPLIGQGSEGHVLKMSYHTTPVAVKIMNNKTLRTRERFKNETKLLSKLCDHENVVKFVGQCKDLRAGEENAAADLVMVMEYCELGNLYKIISEAKWIRQLQAIGKDLTQFKHVLGYLLYSDWRRRLQVACDIAAGVRHMHAHEIVHRDLTSFNVVLKKGEHGSWVAKICDFERSRHIPKNQTIPRSDLIANSPAWSAPEVLREDPYSVQADVFSFGVILWELWTLEEPWKHPEQEIRNPMMIIPIVSNGARLDLPPTTRGGLPHLPRLKALIEACWHEVPSKRPTMHQAHQILLEMIHDMSE